MPRYVIIGGTSSIAEHCARLWLQEGPSELWLVGRDLSRLEAVAADLRTRSSEVVVHARAASLVTASTIANIAADIASYGDIHRVLIAHGSLPDQAESQQNLELAQEQLALNGLSPVLFAEAFANLMQRQTSGQIAVIGSVAGDRGRTSNYISGAA